MSEEKNPEVEEPKTDEKGRTVIEEIEVAGNELVKRVEEIVEQGNARRIIVKYGDQTILEIPLTIAAVSGVVTALVAPQLAILGVIATIVAQVTIQVVRDEGAEKEAKSKVEIEEEE